ncbi:excinuclease ABC subunit UvrC [Bacteroidia bacterium]|nr:excinuclease ABC subunit UvrC [Bacteroidia bacterium]MDB4107198.1 excinuclease ABC subunit UvrC [Bacteroidia bacterium]MDB9881887.1 excinuclease ABC subunit UvrC [Bacteroidia bacterium]MDC1394922.1 excinuclease ABC subunit UvrC [Bacteroidia bacterium]
MAKPPEIAPVTAKLKLLPEEPGVYKYFDKSGNIIYIGKAKNIKNRVRSYFNKIQYENGKTKILVSKIWDMNITVVPTEIDALLLENSLIKEFQPKYNIALRDDKSFPLIKISKEPFPKIFSVRNPKKDGSLYYGPYANIRLMRIVLELCQKIYPTRNCNYNLSEANIKAKKFKVCLEYQIGNCKGACEGLETEEEYNESLQGIKNILRGNLKEVREHLKHKMERSAANWKYEEAAKYKEKLDILVTYQNRSTVVNHRITDVDVLNLAQNDRYAYINYLRVSGGIIIQSKNLELKKKLDETTEELLELAYGEIRSINGRTEEIIVPIELSLEGKFTIPGAGDKKKLLDLSFKNAMLYMREKSKQYEKLDPQIKVDRLLTNIKNDLRLTELPYHMECFDNSNIQGAFPVSACVVFRDGKPSKKDYRHFNIKTVEGPNDFASMYEALTRRYKRMLEEEQPLPQLIIVDGGKGQLSSSVKALKDLNIYGKVAIVGIAKRLEEIYYPGDSLPLYIDKKSESLKVIQQMRDEAHRFGITHHRNRRSKGTIVSKLTEIKGIGAETATDLLKTFKSVARIKKTSQEDIAKVIGPAKALLVIKYFEK